MYFRLKYHFQYVNALVLFSEIDWHNKYGSQIFGKLKSEPEFISLNNLYHPNTIDACIIHDGHGDCGGIKDKEGKWNTIGHKKRIVHYTKDELLVLSRTFEASEEWETTELVSIHNEDILEVLKSLSLFPYHMSDESPYIYECLHETGAVDKGYIKAETRYPNWDNSEMIYCGPHFHVANPLYKTPQKVCSTNRSYDTIDLEKVESGFIARTNYVPCIDKTAYYALHPQIVEGQDKNGNNITRNWMDFYKLGFRKMLNLTSERTLICALLPRKSAHINGVISATFRGRYNSVDMAAICSSV